jgi:hypothetical protein
MSSHGRLSKQHFLYFNPDPQGQASFRPIVDIRSGIVAEAAFEIHKS